MPFPPCRARPDLARLPPPLRFELQRSLAEWRRVLEETFESDRLMRHGSIAGPLTPICVGHNILVMTRSRGAERKGAGSPRPQPVPAAEFKARCLELMDRVRETGVEYIVTKHGVAVARLVPYTEPQKARVFGSMKGTVLGYDRPLDPLEDEYSIDGD